MLINYWQKPVINLAVNAGLGLPYILDVSHRVARPGDTILMVLNASFLKTWIGKYSTILPAPFLTSLFTICSERQLGQGKKTQRKKRDLL